MLQQDTMTEQLAREGLDLSLMGVGRGWWGVYSFPCIAMQPQPCHRKVSGSLCGSSWPGWAACHLFLQHLCWCDLFFFFFSDDCFICLYSRSLFTLACKNKYIWTSLRVTNKNLDLQSLWWKRTRDFQCNAAATSSEVSVLIIVSYLKMVGLLVTLANCLLSSHSLAAEFICFTLWRTDCGLPTPGALP